jgi:biopolymer transport protein TolQ
MNIFHLFWQADIIVKLVMLSLLVMSIVSWSIIIEKYISFKKIEKDNQLFQQKFWASRSIEELYNFYRAQIQSPMASLFVSAMAELKRSSQGGIHNLTSLEGRVERAMQLSMQKEIERMDNRLGFLASVGSTAPFIGLFGTVWGIMNSFGAIAEMQNAQLTTVAPGIAEALFATALGLIASIPAVLAYNRLGQISERLLGQLDRFASEFYAIISRQLDQDQYRYNQGQYGSQGEGVSGPDPQNPSPSSPSPSPSSPGGNNQQEAA